MQKASAGEAETLGIEWAVVVFEEAEYLQKDFGREIGDMLVRES